MKKPVILALVAMYVLAIVIVGIMGGAFKIYDVKIYVQEIECVNGSATGASSSERDSLGDYYIQKVYQEGLVIEVECEVVPDNATNKEIQYSAEGFVLNLETGNLVNESEGLEIILNKTGRAEIRGIKEPGTIYLVAKSTDNNAKEAIIRIDVI